MNKLSKILAIGFCFGVLAMALSLIPNRQVSAANGLAVTVDNSATNPVHVLNVDQPWGKPFVDGCAASSTSSKIASCTFNIPHGGGEVVMKLLTIHAGSDPTNTKGTFALDVFTGGTEHDLFEETMDSGVHQPTTSNWVNTSAYELELDAGSTVQCSWQTAAPNPVNGLAGICTISGYSLTQP